MSSPEIDCRGTTAGLPCFDTVRDIDRLEAELMRALDSAKQAEREAPPKTQGRYWATLAVAHIREAIKAAGTRETLA